jgi:hypothetical protein
LPFLASLARSAGFHEQRVGPLEDLLDGRRLGGGKDPGDLGAYLAELWELAKLYPSGPELLEAVLKVHTQAAGDPALFEDMLAEQADVRENPDFSRKMPQGHLGERRCLGAPRRLVEPVDGRVSSSLGWRKVDCR